MRGQQPSRVPLTEPRDSQELDPRALGSRVVGFGLSTHFVPVGCARYHTSQYSNESLGAAGQDANCVRISRLDPPGPGSGLPSGRAARARSREGELRRNGHLGHRLRQSTRCLSAQGSGSQHALPGHICLPAGLGAPREAFDHGSRVRLGPGTPENDGRPAPPSGASLRAGIAGARAINPQNTPRPKRSSAAGSQAWVPTCSSKTRWISPSGCTGKPFFGSPVAYSRCRARPRIGPAHATPCRPRTKFMPWDESGSWMRSAIRWSWCRPGLPVWLSSSAADAATVTRRC
jgi:hypothetical protein